MKQGENATVLTFSDELGAARKERRFTQEQLALVMNVSRSTVSHWESGRVMPDIDTLKRLSQVLDHDFRSVGGGTGKRRDASGQAEIPPKSPEQASAQASGEASAAVQQRTTPARPEKVSGTAPDAQNVSAEGKNAVLPTTAEASTSQPSHKRGRLSFRRVIPAVLGGVLLCVVLVVLLLQKPALLSASGKQKARVVVTATENPVYAVRNDNVPGGASWLWQFKIEETAGVPFTVQEMKQIYLLDSGQKSEKVITDMQCARGWGTNTLMPNITKVWTGLIPLQLIHAVRLVLYGVDANGNELSFEGKIEFSKEIVDEESELQGG